MIDFDGQAVIVTGAGRGLGRHYALDLARRGARVVVNDIGSSMGGDGTDRAVADEVVDEIEAAGGTAVASYDPVDTPEGAASIVQVASQTFGRLDAVISNAGIFEMVPFDELSVERWRRMLSVHLDGTFYVSQPAFRMMKVQGYGRIVNVASNIAAFGQEHVAHYAAAKGGIIGLTHALANEGAPHGILVNAVLPMGRTRMMLDSLGQREANPVVDQLFEACSSERVVPLVTYLASTECTVSHQLVSAVAGRYARVHLGLGEGWLADRSTEPTAEDVAQHIEQITATAPGTIPMAVADEVITMLGRLEII
jgi:NAD(P)-dependent dehydrogenase (short-subunit alcohol dehydrogenase family)